MDPSRWFQPASIILAACAILVAGAQAASLPRYRSEEVRPLWMKLDRNGDGFISTEELRSEDPALLSRFRKADMDGDGSLSLRELELLLMSL